MRKAPDSDLAGVLNQGRRGRQPNLLDKIEAERQQQRQAEEPNVPPQEPLVFPPGSSRLPSLRAMREYFREDD